MYDTSGAGISLMLDDPQDLRAAVAAYRAAATGAGLAWPADPGEALDSLGFAIGTPFPWRQQVPLFRFDLILFTFVLGAGHEGEVWRYEFTPDAWDTVRAADSVASLFTTWASAITAGLISRDALNGWLQVGEPRDADPLAFPPSVTHYPLLRQRQRECGVDLDCIDRGFDCHEELFSEIDAARSALGV
ncbi:hypothetical protein [Actinoplanes rectilineatus]|uniref:hypothetical protein n=1 Tax=Actinoplanes rectilineatus TaxID=113571 RepID=UPI000698DEA7|nr:hypothetical protein [Actinoplanes rectilineatus]